MATEGGPASGIESDTGGEPQQPVEVEAQKQTQVPLNKKERTQIPKVRHGSILKKSLMSKGSW